METQSVGKTSWDAQRSGVMAGVALAIGVTLAVTALHDAPWAFGWHNDHWQQHWAGIAAIVACLHVTFACVDRPPSARVAAMASAWVPLTASLLIQLAPSGAAILTAIVLLPLYGALVVAAARRRSGRRGPWRRRRELR